MPVGGGGRSQFQVSTLEGNAEQNIEHNNPAAVGQITGGTLRLLSERSSMGQCSSEGQPVTEIQNPAVFMQAYLSN